ncbi:MAG: UDP-N-acetylmuramoyl-L-alanine--D-glutamate ligase [Acidimicrobiaceae bacterium]|nr:UDP-N-acetylmuramoyl-L-alanine--D-glutamate ligase [Acidimicrobiaceae bacterium]
MIPAVPQKLLLAGFGAANQAAARSLLARGHDLIVFDDRSDAGVPGEGAGRSADSAAATLGLELEASPDAARLDTLVRSVGAVVPTPGLPHDHPVLAAAAAHGVATMSEFDLAAAWDSRPVAAITGTSGKTTVTETAAAALTASGVAAAAAGNNELPLVSAIDRGDTEVFVVEASSFRLGHSRSFEPGTACWLNFGPDHLDVHGSLAAYEAAKASLWRRLPASGTAVANLDDPTVMSHLRADRASWTFSTGSAGAAWRLEDDMLTGPHGELVAVEELPRALPHDIANALAAAACAVAAGASIDGARRALRDCRPGAHRLQRIAVVGDVLYIDDSKATTPHATVAALRSFERVVLIAGGRNKGLDLSALRAAVATVRSVVTLGEAADELAAVFAGVRAVQEAPDMDSAVALAAAAAEPGDTVMLSPACASFDRYRGYAERGEDFSRAVAEHARSRISAA